MENSSHQSKILLQIQSLFNNTSSSTIEKTSNEIPYDFLPRRLLDLILAMAVLNICVACIDTADAIFFAFFNQKEQYDKKHQSLFMKVGNWAMLRFYKNYSIPSLTGVIKKLTQQYVGPFQINKRVRFLVYRLKIRDDQRIYPVFLITQLELASKPSNNLFWHSHLYHLLAMFVDVDTNSFKSFEINRLLNKQTIKQDKCLTIEYLVCQTGYGSEQDKKYNVKDLNNLNELVANTSKASFNKGVELFFCQRRSCYGFTPFTSNYLFSSVLFTCYKS